MNPPAPSLSSALKPEPVYRIGSLSYTPGGLRKLFFWLLTGDVVFVLADSIEPRILPIILKQHGATDTEIALIVSSLTALMQLIVMPVVSYRSDRTRSPWGRRIPYIFWTTPFVSLLLGLTPFAPEIAAWLMGLEAVAPWLERCSTSPVILCFGVLVVAYRFFQAAASTMFFNLFKDVVPGSHMGRFLALFRIFGALATFVITYWLLGLAETHSKPIFVGIALLNFLGFLGLCIFVKEGTYPPVVEHVRPADAAIGRWPFIHACRTFLIESFRQPIYRWTYAARLLIYSAIPVSGFLIFFPQRELGMPLDQVGRFLSWPALVWLAAAYPVGKLIDRFGAIRMLSVSLVASAFSYAASFFIVVGPASFFASAMITGVLYWVVMLGQMALAQEIFNQERFAQLGSANVLVQSLAIAVVISPFAGWALDALKASGLNYVLSVPVVGDVTIAPYRFVNLMLAAVYGLSWLCMARVRHHWKLNGGGTPAGYVAPL
jgi:MFS family permease